MESFEGGGRAPLPYRFAPAGEAGERIRCFQANRRVRRLSCVFRDVRFWRSSHQVDGFTVLARASSLPWESFYELLAVG